MSHNNSTMDLIIRRATDADAAALATLAGVDSQRVPTGPVLVAEVDGELWAAESLTGGGSIADPFKPTAEVRELLRARVRQLTAEPRRRRGRGLAAVLRRATAG
jgi:hypothetical protein